MPLPSPPQLPGPSAFFVGFASEKHDSSERLPGHRHGNMVKYQRGTKGKESTYENRRTRGRL